MAGYLAMRIEAGKLDYTTVIMRYPQFKADIDTILAAAEEKYRQEKEAENNGIKKNTI